MFDPIQPFLERSGVVILDGGLATELERRGADLKDPLWSAKLLIESPELIRQVHADYFVAGADVATTSSYQATFAGLAERGLDRTQAADILRRSVRLAQEARDAFWSEPKQRAGRLRPLVAASVGCYGAALHNGAEYRGDYRLSQRQLEDFHRPRIEVLAESGADLLACETIPCQIEAEALVRVLEEFPEVPAWISFSCQDDRHVCHGERLAECVAIPASEQVIAVGVNCTPPRFITGLLESVAGVTSKPLVVYPNRGETWNAATYTWQHTAAEPALDWGAAARAWVAAGARLVGGCCRTTPDDIGSIAQALRK